MRVRSVHGWFILFLILVTTGCTAGKKKKEPTEKEAREAFSNLQEALGELRDGDTTKLWDMLCKDSREDAEKFAKEFSAQLAKKTPEEVADLAEEYKVTPQELKKKRDGKAYVRLKSARIYKKYFLMLAAPMDHFTYEDGDMKVYYKGEDEKSETKSVTFVHEGRQWKAVLDLR
jgi:hypothetical protein